MQCDDLVDLLPAAVDGSRGLDRRTIRHVSSCLRCQGELAKYHRLVRRLHQLRGFRPDLPTGLLGDVLEALDAAATKGTVRSALTGRRLAYVGGAALGAAAVGATVMVAVGRGRSGSPLGNLSVPGGNLSNRPCDRRLAVGAMAIDRGQ